MAEEFRTEAENLSAEASNPTNSDNRTSALNHRARQMRGQVYAFEAEQKDVEAKLRDLLLTIPNLPDDNIPDGDSEEFAVEIRRHGIPPSFTFEPRDHVDLGEAMGILDSERAIKLSGPRFSIMRGAGAMLERALATFFLVLHTGRHGYTEFSLPSPVKRQVMTGTGQLPNLEETLLKTEIADRELFLIPTAEVPLITLHAGEILPAETCLKELDLASRIVKLAAGDLGFSSTLTYDIEVWLPSQNMYREISSCSDCGNFQACRAAVRTVTKDGQLALAATLNGSGLPIGRTIAALLEQHQQPDGSVDPSRRIGKLFRIPTFSQ